MVEVWPQPSKLKPWVNAGVLLFAGVVGWLAPWPVRLTFWLVALGWWLWHFFMPPPPLRLTNERAYIFAKGAWQPVQIKRSQLSGLYISVKVGWRPYWWRYWRDSLSEEQWRRLSVWAIHGVLEP